MKGSLEGDERGAAGRIAGQLDRPLYRLRAAVREEDLVELARSEVRDPFRQLDRRLVVGDHRNMDEPIELGFRRPDHVGVAVPQVRHGDAGSEVEVTAAIDGVEIGPLRMVDDERRISVKDLGEVSALARQPLLLAIAVGNFLDEFHKASLYEHPDRARGRRRLPVEAARRSRPTRCSEFPRASWVVPFQRRANASPCDCDAVRRAQGDVTGFRFGAWRGARCAAKKPANITSTPIAWPT